MRTSQVAHECLALVVTGVSRNCRASRIFSLEEQMGLGVKSSNVQKKTLARTANNPFNATEAEDGELTQ